MIFFFGQLTAKLGVDFNDLARHRGVNIRSSLDRLDGGYGLAGGDLVADLGQLLNRTNSHVRFLPAMMALNQQLDHSPQQRRDRQEHPARGRRYRWWRYPLCS